tara:strand:+ start:345 stop:1730 length:1386 start_codon:yes stop_codon:yes gene_type:complete
MGVIVPVMKDIVLDFTAYYNPTDKTFWVQDGVHWTQCNRQMFLDMLKFDPKLRTDGAVYADLDQARRAMCKVRRENLISGVCQLSGYSAGVHLINGRRILVTRERVVVQPKEGLMPFFDKYFETVAKDSPEQRDVLLSWMKLAYQKWSEGLHSPLQMMILVGPSGTGKSLFQEICKRLLGGTIADPYDFLIGRTEFNLELAENALLSFEDRPSFDMKKQRTFFDRVKNLLMSRDQRVRGLYQNGFMADPIRFLMASINAQTHNYAMVPPRENGYEDKFVFTYFSNTGFPMDGWKHLDASKENFEKMMEEELPVLVHYLKNVYKIPEWLLTRVNHYDRKGNFLKQPDSICTRYGMDSWWHPDIAAISSEGGDVAKLVGVLETLMELKGVTRPISVAAKEIAEQLLKMDDVDGAFEFGNDVKKLGYKLRDAALNFPEVVSRGKKSAKGVTWVLNPAKSVVKVS